mmetsp:Transcript_15298/g.45376  ORF Transcript_15298/g.45376 Transcript_15298/m.45376 type:complete len:338 (+) Transcript_15298:43-1056(+)
MRRTLQAVVARTVALRRSSPAKPHTPPTPPIQNPSLISAMCSLVHRPFVLRFSILHRPHSRMSVESTPAPSSTIGSPGRNTSIFINFPASVANSPVLSSKGPNLRKAAAADQYAMFRCDSARDWYAMSRFSKIRVSSGKASANRTHAVIGKRSTEHGPPPCTVASTFVVWSQPQMSTGASTRVACPSRPFIRTWIEPWNKSTMKSLKSSARRSKGAPGGNVLCSMASVSFSKKAGSQPAQNWKCHMFSFVQARSLDFARPTAAAGTCGIAGSRANCEPLCLRTCFIICALSEGNFLSVESKPSRSKCSTWQRVLALTSGQGPTAAPTHDRLPNVCGR